MCLSLQQTNHTRLTNNNHNNNSPTGTRQIRNRQTLPRPPADGVITLNISSSSSSNRSSSSSSNRNISNSRNSRRTARRLSVNSIITSNLPPSRSTRVSYSTVVVRITVAQGDSRSRFFSKTLNFNRGEGPTLKQRCLEIVQSVVHLCVTWYYPVPEIWAKRMCMNFSTVIYSRVWNKLSSENLNACFYLVFTHLGSQSVYIIIY